jgi:Ca2+-binding RTX toxin-like protein
MHGRNVRKGVVAGIAAAALAAGLAGPAQAQDPSSTVSSTSASSMIYTGTDKGNLVEVRNLNGDRYRVDDNGPITPGAGCTPVAGDPTQAICTAFREPNGLLKAITLFGRGGNDTLRNFTGTPMTAHGEAGRDDLVGGSGPDKLLGGTGDSDDLTGNSGADFLDGGPGVHDGVSYSGRSSETFVTLDGVADDGRRDEGDNATATTEDVAGGNASNLLVGNAADNVLVSGPGDDILAGEQGADILIGNDGSDVLTSNDALFLGGTFDDGAVDKLAGDGLLGGNLGDVDTCVISTLDGDQKKDCEQ